MKKILYIILKLLFSFAILYYLITYVEFKLLIKNLISADLVWLTLSIFFAYLNLKILYSRWKILSYQSIGISDSKKIIKSFFIGISSGIITPMRSGEYFGRAIPFGKDKMLDTMVATFFDKMITMFLTTFFGGIFAILFFEDKLKLSPLVLTFAIIIWFLISVFFYFLLFTNKIKIVENLLRIIPNQFKKKIEKEVLSLTSIKKDVKIRILILAFANKIVVLLQFALLIFTFGGIGTATDLVIAGLLVFFTKTYFPPIALADLGIREGAAVFYFGAIGIANQIAFNASIMMFILNLFLPSLIGLYYIFKSDE